MSDKYSLFILDGGLGKHVAATAVAECIKNNHPDRELIVVCAWPQVFVNLPFVDKIYRMGNTPYFYQTYIEDKDSLLFKHEPYFTTEHIHKKLPLIENWCKLYQLEYKGETPTLNFNLIERENAFGRWGNKDKPILLLQTHGGLYQQENSSPYHWTRDMPFNVIQEVVNHFSKTHLVYQVTRSGCPIAKGAVAINEPLDPMSLLSILMVSDKRLLIDSSLQHAAAALNLPSTVLWVGTSPNVFGHKLHNNITAKMPGKFKLPDSFIFDFSFEGVTHECPFDQANFFDIKQIIESLEDKTKDTVNSNGFGGKKK